MPNNLLTICQRVTDAIGFESPAAVMTGNGETARRLRAAAFEEMEELVRFPDKPWAALIRVATITTVASQAEYALPTDFKHVIDDTYWDRSNYWQMRGPLSPSEWQKVKSSVLADSATTRRRFRFVSDAAATNPAIKISIDPTPTANGETLVYEYITNYYCYDGTTGAVKAEWAADTDLPLLDEHVLKLGIIWRFLSKQGLPYEEELNTYERARDMAIARDGGAPILSLAPTGAYRFIGPENVPDTGFGT